MIYDVFPPLDPTASVDVPFKAKPFRSGRDSFESTSITSVDKKHKKIKGNKHCFVCGRKLPKEIVELHDTCLGKCFKDFSSKRSYYRHRYNLINEKEISLRTIEYFNKKYKIYE